MAVPKKKVSPGRRNMRRYSVAYKLDPITTTKCPVSGKIIRTHSVTMENINEYIKLRAENRSKKRAAAASKSV